MIEEPIKYIQKVEIQGLFGRYDIEWNLHSDVNVLAGINGSGKTTIINLISGIFSGSISSYYEKLVKSVIIFFNNGHSMSYEHNYTQIELNDRDEIIKAINLLSVEERNKMPLSELIPRLKINKHEGSYKGLQELWGETDKVIGIELINTFDTELKPSEAIQKLSDNRIKSELDWELYQLQEKYKDYQINIARKKEAVFKENQGNPFMDNIIVEFRRLSYSQERLLEIIDELFSETNKKVNRDKNELEFLLADKEINAYQLSSGEKQLLIILLTVLVQDNKPYILLMDEPEISLHIEWQRKLIRYIRELNPNVQVIIATHSPDIIMEGWMDKVFNVSDIVVKDNATV